MDLADHLRPGMTSEATFTVEEHHLASHVGSGSTRVLATPAMIGFMEHTSHDLIAENLPDGYSSVGVLVNVRHLAPTPLGGTVRVRAEILSVQGSRVTLRVEASDAVERVGEGSHERVVIDVARFLERVTGKQHP